MSGSSAPPEERTRLQILLVEDNPADARLVREMLLDAGTMRFDFTVAASLAETLRELEGASFDAVLLDLGLPDARGLDTLTSVNNAAPDLPVIVLSGLSDENVAVQAVQLGAQDYLVKGTGDGRALRRTVRYAIERKRSEESILHVANHDSLTGLPNRRLFLDRLNQALSHARREKRPVALLFLDLDHFKTINDTLGHTIGDLLLREVAARLVGTLRESDTVARLGGDEFALVLPDLAHVEDVAGLVEKLRSAFRPLFYLGRHTLFVSTSIGASISPKDGEDAETLLRHADVAMYRSKQKGRNTYQFYSSQGSVPASAQLSLGAALRHALDREEFSVHYQPQLRLADGQIVAVEALLRWKLPEQGDVPPEEFIPLAEETGLMIPIGEWVMREACAQSQKWREAGAQPLRIAVNISSRQFNRNSILRTVLSALKETRLPPRQLEVELTESGIMQNQSTAAATMKQLKAIGVRLAIDDFGIGYSSLGYLKSFPIDKLKVDRSFIRDVERDPHDAAIVKAIIAMAHGLQMDCLAEGVETPRQVALLKKYRCDQVQGNFFCPPMSGADLTSLLREPGNNRRI